jgi:Flp pilus assembly protein TadG
MHNATGLIRKLGLDSSGATITEFALVIPIVCTMLLGAFDYGHTLYMQAVLQGEVQKAARDSSLETGTSNEAAINDRVQKQVQILFNHANVTTTRRFYKTFSQAAAAKQEEFTDSAAGPFHDGVCDNGESYTDTNNNGVWDQDGGDRGQGGAKDIVVYTVTVNYPRMFPIDKFIGGSGTTTVSATTVLANQPFGDQTSYGTPTVRQCS